VHGNEVLHGRRDDVVSDGSSVASSSATPMARGATRMRSRSPRPSGPAGRHWIRCRAAFRRLRRRGQWTLSGFGDRRGDAHVPFVVDETFGSWGDAIEVPGLATLNVGLVAAASSISCSMPGDCGAGGVYADGSTTAQAFVANETNGKWATRSRFRLVVDQHWRAVLYSISCPSNGECGGAGQYADALVTVKHLSRMK